MQSRLIPYGDFTSRLSRTRLRYALRPDKVSDLTSHALAYYHNFGGLLAIVRYCRCISSRYFAAAPVSIDTNPFLFSLTNVLYNPTSASIATSRNGWITGCPAHSAKTIPLAAFFFPSKESWARCLPRSHSGLSRPLKLSYGCVAR